MIGTVDQLIDAVIGREGAYTNLPNDRGGPTIWGITEQVARAFGYTGAMQAMPRATAVAIYLRRFWTAPNLDKVSIGFPVVAAELFDAGINQGIATAGQFLQRSLNVLNRSAVSWPDVPTDGNIGALTLAALGSYAKARPGTEGAAVLLWMIRGLRTARYVAIAEGDRTQEAFEYGWIARQVRSAA